MFALQVSYTSGHSCSACFERCLILRTVTDLARTLRCRDIANCCGKYCWTPLRECTIAYPSAFVMSASLNHHPCTELVPAAVTDLGELLHVLVSIMKMCHCGRLGYVSTLETIDCVKMMLSYRIFFRLG